MKTFIALLFLAMGCGAASAADIRSSTKDVTQDAARGETVTWTGAYIGGQIGWTNASHGISLEGPSGTLLDLAGIAGSGVIGGGRAGFDLARGRFLVGAFAEYNLSLAESKLDAFGGTLLSIEKGDEWTIGGRAGILIDPRTLVYGMAGYTQTSYDFKALGGGISVDYSGITAGAGVEFALANGVFMGIEGSHTFYGDETVLPLGGGFSVQDALDETRVMGTVKLKLGGIY